VVKLIESVAEFKKLRHSWAGDRLGFVPTMGALHAGHAALIKRARRECARTAVSVFVNPTQFSNPQDLATYPQPLEQDLQLLRELKVDAVLLPNKSEIYQDNYRFVVHEEQFSRELCGAHRPGHFDGVLTVVLKLLHIVEPQCAYFGEKDFQQLTLIRDMVQALFMNTEIVPCPTVRETDGLAMSSRNKLLTKEHRQVAPVLFRVLSSAASAADARELLAESGFKVDYVEDRLGRRFAAASLGAVRLIDNVAI
jgi:pantoate--beta-alanine ligase